jgi:hypothetical protein
MILHFDNVAMCGTRTVMRQLEQSGFKNTGHPPWSPNLSLYDFFLFGSIKEQWKRRNFAEEEEFLSVLSEVMSEIPPDMISVSFPIGIDGHGAVF